MRNLILTWIGTGMTLICTLLVFYFAPAALSWSDKVWFLGMCAVCVLMLVMTYRGRPRDLAQPLPASVRRLAVVAMILSGSAWVWLIVQTVIADDSRTWTIRVQRTLALIIFAGAYYIASQKPRRS